MTSLLCIKEGKFKLVNDKFTVRILLNEIIKSIVHIY